MGGIFLSYASEDRTRARELAQALEAQGWSVWFDRKIPLGKTFAQVIQERLDAARCVVVLWSEASVRSDWVQIEASRAKSRGVLIPALIEDVADRVPLAFSMMQAAQLVDWSVGQRDREFDALVLAVGELLPRDDNGGQEQRSAATMRIEGNVLNARTDEPMAGVQVRIRVGRLEFATHSGPAGNFRWSQDWSDEGEVIQVTVREAGFLPWQTSRDLRADETRFQVRLEPEKEQTTSVVFVVSDIDGRPLSGADIVVALGAEPLAQNEMRLSPTDANGRSPLAFKAGLHHAGRYTATLPGYERQQGDIRLDPDAAVEIRMRRSAGRPGWLRGVLEWLWTSPKPRLAGMIFLGLWPFPFWLVGLGLGLNHFVLNLLLIVPAVLCVLAWWRPVAPRRAVKIGAVPFVLNELILAEGGLLFLLVLAVWAAAILALVYWINRRRVGGRV